MILRPATAGDLDAISALHVESWRAHYRGMLPDEFLDGPVEEDRLSHWQHVLAQSNDKQLVLVAEADDGLAGFVSAMPSDDDAFDAYIEHLHVRPGLIGGGIGHRLLTEAAGRLVAMGHYSAYLLVFTSNRRAIGFYERLGGETTDLGMADFAGTGIPHSRLAWRDLAGLAGTGRSWNA